MPIQIIELEEITIEDLSDDILEASVNAVAGYVSGLNNCSATDYCR